MSSMTCTGYWKISQLCNSYLEEEKKKVLCIEIDQCEARECNSIPVDHYAPVSHANKKAYAP